MKLTEPSNLQIQSCFILQCLKMLRAPSLATTRVDKNFYKKSRSKERPFFKSVEMKITLCTQYQVLFQDDHAYLQDVIANRHQVKRYFQEFLQFGYTTHECGATLAFALI